MGSSCNIKESVVTKPFVKWAGGKGQLLAKFSNYYPPELREGKIKRYVEPFLGGGAVLFDVMQRFNIKEAFVFDVNKELMNTYQVIKTDILELVEILGDLQTKYINSSDKERKTMYAFIRNEYNKGFGVDDSLRINMAAWFLFLNRTCFNGLYRVNKAGLFNVPPGAYKNPTICDNENLFAVSLLLQKVEIFVGDYRECIKYCDKDAFVYFDPPYRPLNNTSSFTSYSKTIFDDENQKGLGEFFKECDNKGALLMLSNSEPKNENPDDNFFEHIYAGFNINGVMAKRSINSKAGGRGLIGEILVTNYNNFK